MAKYTVIARAAGSNVPDMKEAAIIGAAEDLAEAATIIMADITSATSYFADLDAVEERLRRDPKPQWSRRLAYQGVYYVCEGEPREGEEVWDLLRRSKSSVVNRCHARRGVDATLNRLI